MPSYYYTQHSFKSGILSPTQYGVQDVDAYGEALLDAKNFFVDFRGGIKTRPGTEFIFDLTALAVVTRPDGTSVELPTDTTDFGVTRAVTYRTNSDVDGSDLLLLFSHLELRVFRDGEIIDFLEVPYEKEDISSLDFHQRRNSITICSPKYYPRVLIYDDGFSLIRDPLDGNQNFPTDLTVHDSATGTYAMVYGVSSVNLEGVESPIGSYAITSGTSYASGFLGTVRLYWTRPEEGEVRNYRVYRSGIIPDSTKINLGVSLGLIGEITEPTFIDNGIEPQFEVQPPGVYNPFSPGAVIDIKITDPGASYSVTGTSSFVSNTDGEGFHAIPIVDSQSEVVGERIISQGIGYSDDDVVTFPGPSDVATGTLIVNPSEGVFPSTSAFFQQRKLFAGSIVNPVRIWGSKIAAPSVLWRPIIPSAIDAFELDIEAEELNPIRFLIPTRAGLLVFTGEDIWRLWGQEGFSAELTSEPLQLDGAANVKPINISGNVLYVERASLGVRNIIQGQTPGTYNSANVSILSNHLFTSDNPIVDWTYSKNPHRLVWAIREDGTMLSFTFVPEQGVLSWTRHDTVRGRFKTVTTVQEGLVDEVYMVVERFTRDADQFGILDHLGNTIGVTEDVGIDYADETLERKYFIERFARRNITKEADVWGLDCATRLAPNELTNGNIPWEQVQHLEGLGPLRIMNDGNSDIDPGLQEAPNINPEGGQDISLQGVTIEDNVLFGLPVDKYVETLPIRVLELPTGQIRLPPGRVAPCKSVLIRYNYSKGIYFSSDDGTYEELESRTTETYGESARFVNGVCSSLVPPNSAPNSVGVTKISVLGPYQAHFLDITQQVEADPNSLQIDIRSWPEGAP